jgi:hypothetical protein
MFRAGDATDLIVVTARFAHVQVRGVSEYGLRHDALLAYFACGC